MRGPAHRRWCTLCQSWHAANHSYGPGRTTRHIAPRELDAMWKYIDHGTRTRDDYLATQTSRALTRTRREAHG